MITCKYQVLLMVNRTSTSLLLTVSIHHSTQVHQVLYASYFTSTVLDHNPGATLVNSFAIYNLSHIIVPKYCYVGASLGIYIFCAMCY